MQTQKSDAENYRKLSVPKPSIEQANKDIAAFFEDLAELRKKHSIMDVLCVAQINVIYEDGEEGNPITYSHFGDQTKALAMAAYAMGTAKADMDAICAKLMKGKRF